MSQTIAHTAARPTLTLTIDTADDEPELEEGSASHPHPAAENPHRPTAPVAFILSMPKVKRDLNNPLLPKPQPQKAAVVPQNAPATPTKIFIRTMAPGSPLSLTPQSASPQQSYTPGRSSPSSPFQTPPKKPNSVALMA